jgi:hypothetical protein
MRDFGCVPWQFGGSDRLTFTTPPADHGSDALRFLCCAAETATGPPHSESRYGTPIFEADACWPMASRAEWGIVS